MIAQYGFCGGATVAGLSGTICGLHSSGDRPEQIVFGFAGEFHDAMRDAGGLGPAISFGRTRFVPHDSLTWKETADHFLRSAGVRTLFHSVFLDAYPDERDGIDRGACNLMPFGTTLGGLRDRRAE